MNNYVLILVWMMIIGMLSMQNLMERTEIICGKAVYRYRPVWAMIVFLPLVIWCGFRGYVGDTGTYMRGFYGMPESLSGIPAYLATITKDQGFYVFSALIKCMIGDHVNIYFMILAALQAGMLIYTYRKYSSRYLITFFLFIASTDYISWMFNGIRQFTAVTITFLGMKLILKKKYVSAIILILIASTMHQTALLMLPFVFIAQGKAWNKKTIMFIVAAICAVAFIGRFTNILDTVLAETQYKNVVSDWQAWQDDGTNVLRVLVYAVPALLSLVGLRYIREADDPVINLCTNMAIVATGFYVVSMFTSGIFIGRIPIYFSLYNYILLPWEIDNIFTKELSRLIYFALVIFYLIFYLYSLWGMGMI